jgi:hypothetical protein
MLSYRTEKTAGHSKTNNLINSRGGAERTTPNLLSAPLIGTIYSNPAVGFIVNEKGRLMEQERFKHLPSGHCPDTACYNILSTEVELLRKQARDKHLGSKFWP